MGGGQMIDMDMLEKMMGTTSQVHRWRDAYPDDAGTERDIVKIMRREIERLSQEAGVEKGKEQLKGTLMGVLLMVKRKA
jgi:hypothetical protein